jgi:uncharacterized protein YkwD
MANDSAPQQNDSSLKADLNLYKQAADIAYRYAKGKATAETKEEESPFDETTKDF